MAGDRSEKKVTHPAQYSEALWPALVELSAGYSKILDPMAGIGNIYLLPYKANYPKHQEIHAVEIEPEWAAFDERITLGSVLDLPWPDNYFDCIVVSPPYGNRMADKLGPSKWAFTRHSYATGLGRDLSDGNAGAMQWGKAYREFHEAAWAECARVLQSGGRFILNCKNHYRNKQLQEVTEWHVATLVALGFEVNRWIDVQTPGMRRGRNHEARVDFESVVALDLTK